MTHSTKTLSRLHWLDATRGFIMVVMAIDHASYFIARLHRGEFWGLPMPQYDSALAFLTRFVTHICAPGFFFLMGMSMLLFEDSRSQKGWSRSQIVRHFGLRGGLLILLQITIENAAWLLGEAFGQVDIPAPPGGGSEVFIHLGVLYALGLSMLLWGLLPKRSLPFILSISVLAMLAPVFVIPTAQLDTLYNPLLRALVIPGHTNFMQSYYPLLPWFGVAGLGIAFARYWQQAPQKASRLLLPAGVGALFAFVVLRALNLGDFHTFNGGNWIDFLNVTKYPASPLYLLFTLGVDMLLLRAFMQWDGKRFGAVFQPLLVFGHEPLLFYIAHLYLYALMGIPFPTGTNFAIMYALWLLGLVVLYFLTRWYGNFKSTQAPDSLWRLI